MLIIKQTNQPKNTNHKKNPIGQQHSSTLAGLKCIKTIVQVFEHKCIQIRALNQEGDKRLIVNLLEQEGLDCCDLSERCDARRTEVKRIPRRALGG